MTPTAVKQDLVISAYKPNDGLERRFRLEAGTEEGAWDFVRTHLRQLPIFVADDGKAETIAERKSHMLYDRMVAFHVQRGTRIPLASSEFLVGLERLFPKRDGMYFLSEQAAAYDRKRMKVGELKQLEIFVIDEVTAIQWLRQELRLKPQTFQELHPGLTRGMGGWEKHETPVELREMLEQNFLCYKGDSDVPTQIHSYLSSNFRELRNLPNDSSALKKKAKDRWYVPDPNQARQVEEMREKALMREFDEYKAYPLRRMKVFRLEAVRAGFRRAWQERDYTTIINVARKIPDDVLQEDPKLLMWYDQAVVRSGKED